MEEEKKIYFASDVHLGAPSIGDHRAHEQRFVAWLESIRHQASAIYLLGDIFDFWFEYRRVVPRGFTRFLGKLSEITDSGIPVHFFTGNHDIWVFDYLPRECGVTVHHEPLVLQLNGKKMFLAHGDGLGNYDRKYNFLKALFTNKAAQWLFAHLHPNLGIWIATNWSKQSREKNLTEFGTKFLGADKEWSIRYAQEVLTTTHYDYFLFGHRHLALDYALNSQSRLLYLGDWIQHFSYATFDGHELKLCFYHDENRLQ